MRHQFNPLWLLVCGAFPGCLSAPPIDMSAAKPAAVILGDRHAREEFNLHESADLDLELSSLAREEIGLTIEAAADGSQVAIVANDQQYTGTLLKQPGGRIGLLNCVGMEAVPFPDGGQQCKTSHIPLQSFPVDSLSRFTVFAPPDPDFKAPQIHEDSSSVMISEITFRDGKSWARSAAKRVTEQTANAKVDE